MITFNLIEHNVIFKSIHDNEIESYLWNKQNFLVKTKSNKHNLSYVCAIIIKEIFALYCAITIKEIIGYNWK